MNFEEFKKMLLDEAEKIGVNIKDEQADNFFKYMNLLIEWNEKINLTAITVPEDIILKHFIDSLTVAKYINSDTKVIDVGTGAGFPGIPLGIVRNDIEITLMDSLNKRIKFLDEIVSANELKNIDTIHSRAEELGRNKDYREKYDVAVSRAVAPLNVLLEYMLPFVKDGGIAICMKGANVSDEIENSKKALNCLSGYIEKVDNFMFTSNNYERNIIVIRKKGKTGKAYPRKPGTPSAKPL